MPPLKLRHRHRLRRKEVASLISGLEQKLGCTPFNDIGDLETADAGQYQLLVSRNSVLGIFIDGEAFLTVRGLLAYPSSKSYVTVDMGAVKFVANGADIMAPGIIDADTDVSEGDAVWIRDEKNLRPMAVGQALMGGPEMVQADGGKAVKTIHYVGDKIWALGEE
jgi:PUA domain protein